MIEKLYLLDEAAEKLRIKPKTLSNLISAQRITAIRGKPVRIPETAIKTYLRKKTTNALR